MHLYAVSCSARIPGCALCSMSTNAQEVTCDQCEIGYNKVGNECKGIFIIIKERIIYMTLIKKLEFYWYNMHMNYTTVSTPSMYREKNIQLVI